MKKKEKLNNSVNEESEIDEFELLTEWEVVISEEEFLAKIGGPLVGFSDDFRYNSVYKKEDIPEKLYLPYAERVDDEPTIYIESVEQYSNLIKSGAECNYTFASDKLMDKCFRWYFKYKLSQN